LILETSGRVGQVALAQGAVVLGRRRLDESRRHARDLAPAVAELLAAASWTPRHVEVLMVSKGPGSYTGLRVGIMAAKAFAYATAARLIAIETFAAIAEQAPKDIERLAVLADAQQEKVYVQLFGRFPPGAALEATSRLSVQAFPEWLAATPAETWISGPGLRRLGGRLAPGTRVLPEELWDPQPESLLALGLARHARGETDDPWLLEPLYLRPSAAEEKWAGQPPVVPESKQPTA
jgi:tRNA threonylcarbamoyladenosine biosynthesis protein TsaB